MENVAHVLTELKHLLPMVLRPCAISAGTEFEKKEVKNYVRTYQKKKQAGITHLGSQGENMILTTALKFWKHSLINIRIMIIL